MLFPKFIIDMYGDLILGRVNRHSDLTDLDNPKGGGFFSINKVDKIISLNGQSHDFGSASLEDVKTAIESGNVFTNKYKTNKITGYNFMFKPRFSDYINLF